jgi:serine/threonine protein kinase
LFVREARILANLQHPNIVNVLDFGEDAAGYVMVLEYVHGYNLAQWQVFLNRTHRTVDVEHALFIIGRVLAALEYAHTFTQPDGALTPIVHRDVSPSNVLLDMKGSVRLLDFGIARIEGAGEYKTQGGGFKGKLPFTAPEIYTGQSPSVRSDVYSCGVLLYQLLTNTNPFRGKAVTDTAYRVLNLEPPPASGLRLEVPEGLDEVVSCALAKEPRDRYGSAADFAAALREYREEPDETTTGVLAAVLEGHFFGEMPDLLNLEPLQDRDAAWRQPVPSHEDRPLSGRGDHSGDKTATIGSAPPTPSEGTVTYKDAEPGRSRIGRWAAGAVALAGVAAGGALYFLSSRPTEQSEASRFVVIEKQSARSIETAADSTAAGEPSDSASSGTTVAPSATPQPSVAARSPTRPSRAPGGSDAESLSATFQRQQGRVQACFASHAESVAGQPQVSLRFQVAANGHVESVAITPSALAATALGACLLGVGRSTKFAPRDESVAFSIPIRARRVP